MKKKKEIFDAKKFIEIVLIRDTGNLLKENFDYFTFVIIGQGIEVLGSFFDKEPFDKQGLSQKRFKKALNRLFDKKYSRRGKWLYKNLRCGLAHLLKPNEKIRLTSFYSGATHENHLKRYNTELFIVADVFYEDFKTSCEKLIKKIEDPKNREIPKNKKNSQFLVIEDIQLN